MRPIPIENDFSRVPLLDDVTIAGKGAWPGKSSWIGRIRPESSPRPAGNFSGVNGISGALAGEVGDEQIDIRWLGVLLILVKAQHEVAGTENLQRHRCATGRRFRSRLRADAGNCCSGSRGGKISLRRGPEGISRRSDQQDGDDETRGSASCFFSPLFFLGFASLHSSVRPHQRISACKP